MKKCELEREKITHHQSISLFSEEREKKTHETEINKIHPERRQELKRNEDECVWLWQNPRKIKRIKGKSREVSYNEPFHFSQRTHNGGNIRQIV